MYVLVTRPEPDPAELKAALESLGHEVSVEPLLAIQSLPFPAVAFEGARGVIVTSRNGLRALAGSAALARAAKLPIFSVGPATAALARVLGFEQIIAGEGSASDLVPLIADSKIGEAGPLVHVAGEEVAFDLAAELAASGVKVRKVTAYRAVAVPSLTPHTAQAIAGGSLDAVILMSPRTAAIFAQLIGRAGLEEPARRLAYICLSANVAAALGDLAPARVNIAVRPNSSAILDAVGRVATHSSGV
jgi:uroporphyrinogen-III synthase